MRVTIMSLGPSSPTTSSTLPASPADHGCDPKAARDCLRLHAVGFAVPRPSPAERCALTAPFHPCLQPKPHRRSVLCGTVPDPQSTSRWALPTTVILPCSDFPRRSKGSPRSPARRANAASSLITLDRERSPLLDLSALQTSDRKPGQEQAAPVLEPGSGRT